MLSVKFKKRMLKDISKAKIILEEGILNCQEDSSILQKELKKIQKEIKKINLKLKQEMKLKGFKSLKERIKISVIDICSKENIISNSQTTKDQIDLAPQNKKFIIEKEYFKTSDTFDFRNHSSEFINLKKINNDKKEILKKENEDLNENTYFHHKKISFGKNIIVTMSLKEMIKQNKKINLSNPSKIKKSILKHNEPKPTFKRKKLKQIIQEEIKRKIK